VAAIMGVPVLISEQLPSGTGLVTFSSIPATYRDLILVVRGRGTTVANAVLVNITLNNDAAGNYDQQRLNANNATPAAAPTNASSKMFSQISLPAASATADVAGSITAEIFNYRDTNFQKSGRAFHDHKIGTTASSMDVAIVSGFWRSKLAVNRVDVALAAGNYVNGSVVSLYCRP
jgi:hypothetical protein